jgi:hypothetical protein
MAPNHTQNLNARLSRRERPGRPAARPAPDWRPSAIESAPPPVRIVGARRRYPRGYLVNV